MFQQFNEVNKHLAKLTPFERAMFRNIPREQYHYFRYSDLVANEDFMNYIDERMLTSGSHELDRAIEQDDAEEVSRTFLPEYIQYEGESTNVNNTSKLYTYLVLNRAFAYKSYKTVRALLKHEFVRRNLTRMLSTKGFLDVRGMERLFKFVDTSSRLFRELFIEDSFIMDCIKVNPDNIPFLYESLVLSTIEGRHYEGIEVLRSMDNELIDRIMRNVDSFPRGKPEQRFIKVCLHGYCLWKFNKSINVMTVTEEPIDWSKVSPGLTNTLKTPMDTVIRLYLENAYRNSLLDEAFVLLANVHYEPIDNQIREHMHWQKPFKRDGILLGKYFSRDDITVIRSSIENDNPSELMALINEYTTEQQAFTMLSMALKNKAYKCLNALLIQPDISPKIKRVSITPIPIYYTDFSCFYGAVAELGDEYMEPLEDIKLIGLMYAASDNALFAKLYTLDDHIKSISMDYFNDFRYAMVVGSIVHMNVDAYNWLIEELYEDEEEFLSDFYLRYHLITDEYHFGEHRMMKVFKAFKLYQKVQDYTIEHDL